MTRQGDGQFFILRKTLLCRRCGVVRMSVPKDGGITVNKFHFLRGHIFEDHFYALCGDISLLILP